MRKNKKRVYRTISLIFIFAVLFSVFVFLLFDKNLSYQLELYSGKLVANKITSEVSDAVIREIEESEIKYDNLVKIEKDIDGKVTCVSADMMAVNLLKNKLDIAVSRICMSNTYYEAKIPVGNLLGNGLFYGKGFDVSIKFKPIGKTSTNMTGNFNESGINQTIYRISFDVDVEAAVVFPFRYTEIPIRVETVIAETVIVGEVPESFTHFDLNGNITSQDFQGYVEDYMAE